MTTVGPYLKTFMTLSLFLSVQIITSESDLALAQSPGGKWQGSEGLNQFQKEICGILHGGQIKARPGTQHGSVVLTAVTDGVEVYVGRVDPWEQGGSAHHAHQHRHVPIDAQPYEPGVKQNPHPEIVVWVEPNKNKNQAPTIKVSQRNVGDVGSQIEKLQRRLDELFPKEKGVKAPQIMLVYKNGDPIKPGTPLKLGKSALLAPILAVAGAGCAQAGGVDPGMIDGALSAPLTPADLAFAIPEISWNLLSENYELPGSKSYEMKQLAEAYENAPRVFAGITGIGGLDAIDYDGMYQNVDEYLPQDVPASQVPYLTNGQLLNLQSKPDGSLWMPPLR